jgi:cyclopropane fatty-acyl-phospholipid synthase-like methyltransferase
MSSMAYGDPIYVMGFTESEVQRLTDQGRLAAPYTRALLLEAGVGPGMRVLDVGCGAGDVSLLAAELVGPSGEVVGLDINARALELARARCRLRSRSTSPRRRPQTSPARGPSP